jgi:hypothetical protein
MSGEVLDLEHLLPTRQTEDLFDTLDISRVDISNMHDNDAGFRHQQLAGRNRYTVSLSRRGISAGVHTRNPRYNLLIVNNGTLITDSNYIFAGRVIEGDFELAARLYVAAIEELNRAVV